MSRPVRFVLAQEGDAAEIVKLRRKIWSTTYRGIYPDSMIDEFDHEWHMEKELLRIRSENYCVYLIVLENRSIGYLTMRKGDPVLLQSLYILDECQKQGVGRLAMNFVRNYCAENGASAFICHCQPENAGAMAFYQRMGGRIVGRDLDNEESWQNSVIFQFGGNE